MRWPSVLTLMCFVFFGYGQQDDRISTIDFVQIVDNNKEEAIYYYQNNWKVLRDMAVNKGYIHSYQVLEAPVDDDAPFELILITTYTDLDQYELREDRFGELIEEKGDLRLLNDKKPDEFRKNLYFKEMVKHWN